MTGGGNNEFEWYVNNRTNSFVRDGKLFIKPSMTDDAVGADTVKTGKMDIWGGSSVEGCTNNLSNGCKRDTADGNVINPVRSARLRTLNSFSMQYGRLEVVAKMPAGDWMWPAIWMLPTDNAYGPWPASGEIDLVESRGNNVSYAPGGTPGGNNVFGSTLHWGPDGAHNMYAKTHEVYTHTESLANAFHTYGMYWDQDGFFTYFDDPSNKVLEVDWRSQSFWQRGGFEEGRANPWVGETENAAPFNQEFHLIMNVAVGGTNWYFAEGYGGIPWSNFSPNPMNEFYAAKDTWLPTWKGDDAAMQIDSVKVWSLGDEKKDFKKQNFM